MIHILLATHGKFAEGLLDSAQMVYGKLAQTTFVSLRDEEGIDAFKLEFALEIKKQSEYADGILVLCDMQSGTPFNIACCHSFSADVAKPVAVICGVNFPMLLMSMDFLDETDVHRVANTLVLQAAESMIYARPPRVEPDAEF